MRRFRSARTGQYVTKAEAATNADTTVSETTTSMGVAVVGNVVDVVLDGHFTPDEALALASELITAANTANRNGEKP